MSTGQLSLGGSFGRLWPLVTDSLSLKQSYCRPIVSHITRLTYVIPMWYRVPLFHCIFCLFFCGLGKGLLILLNKKVLVLLISSIDFLFLISLTSVLTSLFLILSYFDLNLLFFF